MVVKSLKCLFILFPCTMLHDQMITWNMLWLSLTCYFFGTWYLTLVLDMLSLDTWYMLLDNWHVITYLTCYHLVLVHLTRYCDTWPDTITLNTCISLHIHDYHFYGDLAWLLYCYHLPDIWYPWTPVLLKSCILELLKKGDSWYYTPVDPRNWITINIWLLWIPCGHYHWTNCNN